MFFKRKQPRKMKGKVCAYKRPQREYIKDKESSSPIVPLYSFRGLCVMNTMDDWNVLTVDIPGVFIQGDWS